MLSYLSMNLFATFAFLLPGHPTLSTTFDYLKQQKTAEKTDTNAQWFHCSWSILLKRVNIRVRGFHLFLFPFFLLFGLTSINFLVLASIKLDSFPFHMSFCSFFHTCTISLVEAIALWTWKATSGMSYPRSETVFFLFLVLFWRSPHILLPLRSYSAFFLIWLQFGFCLFTDRKNQMKPNAAATRDRSRSQILDETHEHLLVRSSSHHIRHVIRHFQSLEVKASAITPSDYENISTWCPACQLLEDLTVKLSV